MSFDHRLGGGEGAPAVSSLKVVDYPLAPSSRDDGLDAPIRLRRFNRHPWQASVSTSYTVLSRNRDQFLRIVAVRHNGRTPTAGDARHDYHIDLDAM